MKSTTIATTILLSLAAAACGGDSASDVSFEDFPQASVVVMSLADDVIIPTYAALASEMVLLNTAVEALAADTSDTTLATAQDAWKAARVPWEASEGFLFGPVDSLGLDPAIDSWPVDKTALDGVLTGGDELTIAFVKNLEPTLHGFHTAEYMLFGEGGTQTAATFTARELAYLETVTTMLVTATAELEASWTTGSEPYGDLFRAAGNNTTFPSTTSAVEEFVRGMIGIADEVANGKIGDPYTEQDTKLVESQFAFNSLTDFTNNIRSIENGYLGAVPFAGTSGMGITAYVASEDPALDTRFKSEITAAITALGQIPEPFRDAILVPANATVIEDAQTAILTIQATLENDILPLVL